MPRQPEFLLRQAIIRAAKQMSKSGLSPGRSGNISVRFEGGMLITASGIMPADLKPETDVVFVAQDGSTAGIKAPSTEWRFHLSIYRMRGDANAVVHCHSRYATALACLGRNIPAFHYMVAK